MAGNTLPIVPRIGKVGKAVLSTAVTGRTVTGITGLTLLFTADATNGSRVDTIQYTSNAPIGTPNSANVLRIWHYTGSGNATLIYEFTISAVTPSATVAGATGQVNFVYPQNQLALGAAETLYASLHTYAGTQDGFNVIAYGGDY